MRFNLRKVYIAALMLLVAASVALADGSRLKEIATFQGVQNNQLMGYGLVVGLDGTGDSQQTKFTTQSIVNMLKEQHLEVGDGMKVKNVAAVMITATLPPFARKGSTIDVVVSSLGDAKSLKGGTLMLSELKAANGSTYAVAQGPMTVGGFVEGSGGASVVKNHTLVGRVPGGAIIVEETKTEIVVEDRVNITLNSNDFTTAQRAADAIDERLGGHYAKAVDANVISVAVPDIYKASLVSLISDIESVEVKTDSVAKVIVNERTGTVIIGAQARISPVAVAHGSLTVEVTTNMAVSQPKPLSKGKTVAVPQTDLKVTEEKNALVELKGGTTIEELVRALNALRVSPRDLISILQAIKEADALQAQLEII